MIFYLVGLPPVGLAITIFLAIGLFGGFGLDLWRHCHLPISLGRFNRLVNAPVMHQINHSAESRHWDKNLGGDLMIFDWMLGTLYLPEKGEKYRWALTTTKSARTTRT